MSDWISVKERAPKPGEWVLCVYTGDRVHSRGFYDRKSESWYESVVDCGGEEIERHPAKVTDWMTWPSPPSQIK